MGGYGSGRHWGYGAKTKVEECGRLDVNWLTREGTFDGDGRRAGAIRWSNTCTGEETSSIGYEVNVAQRWMRLHYRLVRDDTSFDYKVSLTTTDLPWGGVRWWFVCPLAFDGRSCGRRVGTLYLPPGGRYYGCRHCYNLTYESCNESHRFDHLFRGEDGLGMSGWGAQAILEEGRGERDFERRRKRNEQRRRRRKARNWA